MLTLLIQLLVKVPSMLTPIYFIVKAFSVGVNYAMLPPTEFAFVGSVSSLSYKAMYFMMKVLLVESDIS